LKKSIERTSKSVVQPEKKKRVLKDILKTHQKKSRQKTPGKTPPVPRLTITMNAASKPAVSPLALEAPASSKKAAQSHPVSPSEQLV
jgi:hypothetical protein